MRCPFPSLVLACSLLLWSVPGYAQADAPGTLYVYTTPDGEELVSPTPREDLTFVTRLLPTGRAQSVRREASSSSLEMRMAPYLELVYRIAPEHGVDPVFVLAIMYAESHFNPDATSSVGAMGLMQIMPSTARKFGADDPYDPEQNITAGCTLLARLHARYDGDVALMLAAYSAGDVHVKNHGGVPSFSVKYIARVVRAHAQITDALTP